MPAGAGFLVFALHGQETAIAMHGREKGTVRMGGIVYDARRIRAFEGLQALGDHAGKDKAWLDGLWAEMLADSALMKEFMYYLDHHTFLDELQCRGYALTDLYVWQMDRYNLVRDIGKNTTACNKEAMALGAFRTMADMQKDPETYLRRLTSGEGMDQVF